MNAADSLVLRQGIIDACHELERTGLNRGTSGNISCRDGEYLLITPSGVPVKQMWPESIVAMDFSGQVAGSGKPSSEWHFHLDLLKNRPELNAIVHTHSPHATALACLREDLPPFHYMIAIAGGDTVRCAPYALFGTETLSAQVLKAMKERKACLLANHGLIAAGRDLDEAMAVAIEIESLCEQYLVARQVGQPALLSPEEMQAVMERFRSYGRNVHLSQISQ